MKKSLISILTIGAVIGSSALHSNANEPILTEDGEVVLDVEQEPYQDLSTFKLDETGEEVILDDPTEYKMDEPQVQLDQPEVKLDTFNEPKAKVKVATPDKQESGAIDFDNFNPWEDGSNEGYKPPTGTGDGSGKMIKDNETFKKDVSDDIVVSGTRNIKSLKINNNMGLVNNSYTISGKKLTFHKDKLNNSSLGTYVFEVTFDNGDISVFKLRVDGPRHPDDYWSANITTFNINPTSNRHVDLELVSAATELKIHHIMADNKVIPPSAYRVHGGTIVIDKAFLSTLGVNEFVRINVLYNKGQYTDAILTIINETVSGGIISPTGC